MDWGLTPPNRKERRGRRELRGRSGKRYTTKHHEVWLGAHWSLSGFVVITQQNTVDFNALK